MSLALVTGASRGIGACCAVELAKAGFDVAVNYNKSEQSALSVCEKISALGVRTLAVKADVSDPEQVQKMFSRIKEKLGDVSVLVNNAGISVSGLITDMTDTEWNTLLGTNLSSVFYCSKAALPDMLKAHSGVIVNIASMWGEVGASCEVAYSAAKAGIIGFTKALAKEVGPSGIRVNAVSPGVVMTDMMAEYTADDVAALKEETPLEKLGTPEDIARAVGFLVSDKASFITGQVLSVNGGFVI